MSGFWGALVARRFHIIWITCIALPAIAGGFAIYIHRDALGDNLLDAMMLEAIGLTVLMALYGSRLAFRAAKLANSFNHIAVQTRDGDLIRMFEEFRQVGRILRTVNGKKALDVEFIEEFDYASYQSELAEAGVPQPDEHFPVPADVIKKVFNYYEATAIGIKRHALDEDLVKSWWRKRYILDWIEYADYIRSKRKTHKLPKLFIEYESLVRKWATEEEAGLI